jgi:hypothetical protein
MISIENQTQCDKAGCMRLSCAYRGPFCLLNPEGVACEHKMADTVNVYEASERSPSANGNQVISGAALCVL